MSLFTKMGQDFDDRWDRLAEREAAYLRGDISKPEVMGSQAATYIGTVTDPIATLVMEAADWLSPPQVDKALKDIATRGMEAAAKTDTVQSLVKAAEENPRIAASLSDALELTGVAGVGSIAKKGVKELSKDVSLAAPNKQGGGFYGGGSLGQGTSVFKTGPQALLDTLYAYTSPKAMAELQTNPKALQRVSATALDADGKLASKKAKLQQQKEALVTRLRKDNPDMSMAAINRTKAGKALDGKIADIDRDTSTSWIEGQADQQAMLLEARGDTLRGPIADFAGAQYNVVGDLDAPTIGRILDVNPNIKAYGVDVDDELLDTLTTRILNAQGVKSGEAAPLVMNRNDRIFSDLSPESMKGFGADVTNNLYRAMEARKAVYGDAPFRNAAEFEDFAALARIEQKALTKTDKKTGNQRPANWGERQVNKHLGKEAAKKLGVGPKQTRTQANSMIDSYFSLQRDIEASDIAADAFKKQASDIKAANPNVNFKGKALGPNKEVIKAYRAAIAAEKKAATGVSGVSAQQRKKFLDMKKRLSEVKKDFTTDEKGRIYFGDSHHSRAKALGGVNDQIVIDKQGNVITMINDENDLFGMIPGGHRRTIAVPTPYVYNIFDIFPSVNVDNSGLRREFTESMRDYGVQSTNKSVSGMNKQLAEASVNYTPTPTAADANRVRQGQAGMLYGALGLGAANEEERGP